MRILKTFNDPGNPGPSYHLGIEFAHPNVISGGDPERIERLAEHFLDDVKLTYKRGLVTAHGIYEGVPITAFSTGMGPSSASITIPEIIEACNDNSMLLLRIGTCGGLQSRLGKGHYVVTDGVHHDELVSAKIMGHGYQAFASPEFRDVINATTGSNLLIGQQVHVGTSVVSDIIYFDADGDLNRYGDSLGISMEFSVFCALRDWYNQNDGRKIKAGNLLRVSNMVVDSDYRLSPGVELPADEEIEMAHIKAGLDSLVAMRRSI